MNCEGCGKAMHREGWRYCKTCREKIAEERIRHYNALPYYLKTDGSQSMKNTRMTRGEQHKNPGKASCRRADKR